MAIDLDEAFRRAAKHFYDGNSFGETEKVKGKPSKYSKSMFDDYEKGLRRKSGSMSKSDVEADESIPGKESDEDNG